SAHATVSSSTIGSGPFLSSSRPNHSRTRSARSCASAEPSPNRSSASANVVGVNSSFVIGMPPKATGCVTMAPTLRRVALLQLGDESGEEVGLGRQAVDQDVLVLGVGAVAGAAQAVEGRDAERSGEVAVAPAAGRAVPQVDPRRGGDGAGAREELLL